MSRITYHYLLNGSMLQGNYIYDSMHLLNKSLQNRVWSGYITDRTKKIMSIYSDPDTPDNKKEWANQMLNKLKNANTPKDKMNILFSDSYNRMGLEKILGKPYFGVWGIHTTPADLFGVDPRYKVRLKIDCDVIDPDCIIIKVSTGNYSKFSRSMDKAYFKYSPSIYDKYCKPFQTNETDDIVKDAYDRGPIRTVSSSVPDIIFFLPRIKFNQEDIEVYKK